MPKNHWPPFEKAKKIVQGEGIRTWSQYALVYKKLGLPSNANHTYRDRGWTGAADFFGVANKPRRIPGALNKRFVSFDKLRLAVRSHGFKKAEEYSAFLNKIAPTKVGPPSEAEVAALGGWPRQPNVTYRGKGWIGWADFLGTDPTLVDKKGSIKSGKWVFPPYEEARKLARSLGCTSSADYSARRPETLPKAPQYLYRKEWHASEAYKRALALKNVFAANFWTDFLNISPRYDFVSTYDEARELARAGHFTSITEYEKNVPKNLPVEASVYYENKGWISWSDYLGAPINDIVEMTATKKERQAFLKELVEYSDFLSEADLLLVARKFRFGRTASVLDYLQAKFPNKALSEIIPLLKSQGLQVVSDVPADDEALPETKDILPLVFTDDHALVSPQSLRIMDWAASKGFDPVAIQWLANSQLNRLRNKYVLDGEQAAKGILAGDGGFLAQIKEQFLQEVEGAEAISVPEWQLKVDGSRREPTRMQRMTAYQMTQRRTWGNWSGAGAGKTAAAGLAAFATNSQFTLIVGVNSTLQGWRDQLHKTFGHHAKVIFDISKVKPGRGTFLIWNYEKFQTLSPTPTEQVAKLKPDMIVLDEVQFIKHRSGDEESIRRVALLNLLSQCPTSKVLCMSATPVINDLSEGVSLAEIAKGRAVKLPSRRSIGNAMTVHYELVGSGLRYLPEYKQEMKQIPVTHTIADWDQTNLTLLEFEQRLAPHRLDAVRDKIRPGTIIYTYYLEGVEDIATDYVRSLGFSVAKYTGNENASVRERIQKKFVRGDIDVLVGSQAMAVGIDGLQERCNRIIFLSLPWTYAAYEQIIGRVYRTGSKFEPVEVFIPQVLTTSHKTTYDTFRWSLLRDKRTLAECATDGVIPNLISLNRNAVLEMVRKEMVQEGKSAKGVGAP